jgi:hypothetical protein
MFKKSLKKETIFLLFTENIKISKYHKKFSFQTMRSTRKIDNFLSLNNIQSSKLGYNKFGYKDLLLIANKYGTLVGFQWFVNPLYGLLQTVIKNKLSVFVLKTKFNPLKSKWIRFQRSF